MIQGLQLIENFISSEQEQSLWNFIDTLREIKRPRFSVASYGFGIPYNGFLVSEEIPSAIKTVVDSLTFPCDSVEIKRYREGQDMRAHIDGENAGAIFGTLSLVEGTMEFSKQGEDTVTVQLPARSLLVLSGEARNQWLHKVLPVNSERWSIVFRKFTPI